MTNPEARAPRSDESEARTGWLLTSPALATILFIALFPLGWTIWESLHEHDLRMPWLGRPFVGLGNYLAIMRDERFWQSLGHTALFATISVAVELVLGLALALARSIVERAVPRPATPIYSQLSELLQIALHRALSGQAPPDRALHDAARAMTALIDRTRVRELVASKRGSR